MAQLAHSDNDLFQEFEIHRRYANSHLRSYFEVLDQHSSRDGLSGLLVFKLGTFAGAALLTIHFVRECQKQTQLVPLQHKVRGLIRAFKNGTIRYRDLDEVLLASLD
ncbi:unnamed protein product [Fusarium graminearum]|nr:unnamed protein product [Fusarium graminearum]